MAGEDRIEGLLRDLDEAVRERVKDEPLMLVFDHLHAVEPEARDVYAGLLAAAARGGPAQRAIVELVKHAFEAGRLRGQRELAEAKAPDAELRYLGIAGRDATEHEVFFEKGGLRRPLPQRQDVRNHSPTGLAWGYEGSGPAQLALAILCHAVGAERALPLYQDFKREFIAGLDQKRCWKITRGSVVNWVARREAERAEKAGA